VGDSEGERSGLKVTALGDEFAERVHNWGCIVSGSREESCVQGSLMDLRKEAGFHL
jgi:hypothetical protein